MTWIYTPNSVSSPGTPGLRSGLGSLASTAGQYVTSNKTPTVSPSYEPIYETDTLATPPYGTTSEPLTDDRGEEPTSSPQGSLANHTAWQATETSTTTETSGPTHSGSLAKWSPDSSCWRTYQVSMWAMLDGNLTGEPWSDSFPNWGTMRNGELIPLPKPEPLTTAEDGGYWATPTVNNSKNNAGPSQMDRHGPALDVQVAVSSTSGVLSADWVEWLMGIPQGWTDIDRKAAYDTWIAGDPGAGRLHWVKEDGLPRTVTNQKNRVSRLKMLGNGIVPGTAALAIKELSARLL